MQIYLEPKYISNLSMQTHLDSNTDLFKSSGIENLDLGILYKKLEKAFHRVQGMKLCPLERQWIFNCFYWIKKQPEYRLLADWKIYEKVSEISRCSASTIREVIKSDEIYLDSEEQQEQSKLIKKGLSQHHAGEAVKKGHEMPKLIPPEIEEEVKSDVLIQLRRSLEAGKPVNSTEVRARLKDYHDIDISKSGLHEYLKDWKIDWMRMKEEEIRKELQHVKERKKEFLEEIMEELLTPDKSCTHRLCSCI